MLMCYVLSQRDVLYHRGIFCVTEGCFVSHRGFFVFLCRNSSRDVLQLLLEREVQYKSVMSCDFVLSVVLCNPSDSICFTVTS